MAFIYICVYVCAERGKAAAAATAHGVCVYSTCWEISDLFDRLDFSTSTHASADDENV